MVFSTEFSVYEIDTENKMIRRLTGIRDATPRQGKDGEWKKYGEISKIAVGEKVVFMWAEEDGILKTTVTSQVVEIDASSKN